MQYEALIFICTVMYDVTVYRMHPHLKSVCWKVLKMPCTSKLHQSYQKLMMPKFEIAFKLLVESLIRNARKNAVEEMKVKLDQVEYSVENW